MQKRSDEFQIIIDSIPALVFYKDKKNRFLLINKALEEATGIPKEKLEGKSLFDLYPNAQAEEYWKDDLEVMKSGKAKRGIIESMETPRGIRFFRTDKIPHLDEHGNIIGIIGFSIDITDQKKVEDALKESEEKFRVVVETAVDAIISADEKGNVTFWNNGAEKMFGYQKDEVLGKSLTIIMPKEYQEAHSAGMKRLSQGGTPRIIGKTYAVKGLKKNGEEFSIDLSLSMRKVNEEKFYTAIIRDISERERLSKLKSEFVSITSHQLRTPLTAIRWIIERLIGGKIGKLSRHQKDYLNDIYDSNRRMIKLVDDLLSVSRLEEGRIKVEPKPVQLEEVVETAIKDNESLINNCKCRIPKDHEIFIKKCRYRLSFDKPKKNLPPILLDESLASQVVNNLLANALRYSSPNAKVMIKLEKRPKDYLLTFQDNGIGIPKDKQYRIFEKFFRADNARKTQTEGTGLGLYISKMIVEMFGGKIWFESEENKGATFHVSLPIEGMKIK